VRSPATCFLAPLLVAPWIAAGCAEASRPPIETVGRPTIYEGVITSVRGSTPVEVGQTCRVVIDRIDHPVFNCRVRIHCGDEVLYGLPDAGFNRCREEERVLVEARDRRGTRRDGDPRMRMSLERREVLIRDDDPDVRVRVGLAPD